MNLLECPVCHWVGDGLWDLAAHVGQTHTVLVRGYYYLAKERRFVLTANERLTKGGAAPCWRCPCGEVRRTPDGIIQHLYATQDVVNHLIDATLRSIGEVSRGP